MPAERVEALVLTLSADIKAMERAYKRAQDKTNEATLAIEKRFAKMNSGILRDTQAMAKGLASAIAAIGVATAVREAAQLAEAWTTAGNRLAAAGVAFERQGALMNELTDLSLQTRTELGSTVELYARLMRATEGVASSQTELVRATRIINEAFKAGGASASEQASAVMQLGQALGSGVLQGEELRALRENAPLLAQAIAREFGVTTAELKKLGEEGVLTTDRVFKGILNAGKAIGDQFKVTQVTISEAFTNLETGATRAIGKLDEMYGVSAAIANVLQKGADALNGGSGDAQPKTVPALQARSSRVGVEVLRLREQTLAVLEQEADANRQLTEDERKRAEAAKQQHLDRLNAQADELRRLRDYTQAIITAKEKEATGPRAFFGPWVTQQARDQANKLKPEMDAYRTVLAELADLRAEVIKADAGLFLDLEPAADPPAKASTLQRYMTDLERFKGTLDEIAAANDTVANKSRAVLQALVDYGEAVGDMDAAVAAWLSHGGLLTAQDVKLLQAEVEGARELYAVLSDIDALDTSAIELDVDTDVLEEALRQIEETAKGLGVIDTPEVAKLREDIGSAVRDGFRQGLYDDNWGDALRSMLAGAMTSALDDTLNGVAGYLTNVLLGFTRSSGDMSYWDHFWAAAGNYVFGSILGGSGSSGAHYSSSASAFDANSYFGGGRASGGPVSAGSTYRINEAGKGEFLFMGNNAGQVLTAAQINNLSAGGGRSGAGVTINAGLTVQGSIDAASWPMVQQAMAAQERRIAQAVPTIVDRQMVDGKRNRRPGYR